MTALAKVSGPIRQQYFNTLWLLTCWAMGRSSKGIDGCSQVMLLEAEMVLKEAKPDDLMIDDMCAGSLDEAFWSGAHSGIGGPLSLGPEWLLPRCQKQGRGRFPRLHQPRAAETKRSPHGTRLP